MSRVVLSVGSNVGDRLAYLQSTVDALRPHLRAVSPVYESEPFGTEAQDLYLNAVLVAQADVVARQWLERARAMEASAGRVRTRRWAPRTLDVDVISVDAVVGAVLRSVVSDDPELTLPHPRAHQRAFVLVPWLDVDPAAVLPGHGPVRDLVAAVDTTGVRRRDDLALA